MDLTIFTVDELNCDTFFTIYVFDGINIYLSTRPKWLLVRGTRNTHEKSILVFVFATVMWYFSHIDDVYVLTISIVLHQKFHTSVFALNKKKKETQWKINWIQRYFIVVFGLKSKQIIELSKNFL